MSNFLALALLRLVALAGSILSTLGVLTFFMFDSLVSHRWLLISGGFGLIITSELLGMLLARRAKPLH